MNAAALRPAGVWVITPMLVLTVGEIASLGCGSGTSGPARVTTVAAETTLSDLDGGQLSQVCSDTFDYLTTLIPPGTLCLFDGLSAATALSTSVRMNIQDDDVQRACVEAYATCLASDDPPAASGQRFGCVPFAGCSLTVSAYSACVRDATTLAQKTYQSYPTCNQISLTSLAEIAPNGEAPPADAGLSGDGPGPASCLTLQDACPGVHLPLPFTISGQPILAGTP